ncbi:MAG TPA: hypothetical protein VF461_17485, partial [Gemmatimonadaceae bacterium]
MGCIARLGCLILLVCLAIGAWFTRDQWLHKITGKPAVTSTAPQWQPLTPEASDAGKKKLDELAKPSGPVFTNLSASEVASYVFQTVARTIPAKADSAEAAVIGDALFVRAIVPVREIAGTGVLGPLAGLLNDRERLQLGGAFHVIRPGLSEFEVREIKLRDFKVPTGAIPRLVRQLSHGERPEGISPNALPVTTPRSLADVRIANGKVTLYKTT